MAGTLDLSLEQCRESWLIDLEECSSGVDPVPQMSKMSGALPMLKLQKTSLPWKSSNKIVILTCCDLMNLLEESDLNHVNLGPRP